MFENYFEQAVEYWVVSLFIFGTYFFIKEIIPREAGLLSRFGAYFWILFILAFMSQEMSEMAITLLAPVLIAVFVVEKEVFIKNRNKRYE